MLNTEPKTENRKGSLSRNGLFRNIEISSETYRMSWNMHSQMGEESHRGNGICKGPEAGIAGPVWEAKEDRESGMGVGNEAQSEDKWMGNGQEHEAVAA